MVIMRIFGSHTINYYISFALQNNILKLWPLSSPLIRRPIRSDLEFLAAAWPQVTSDGPRRPTGIGGHGMFGINGIVLGGYVQEYIGDIICHVKIFQNFSKNSKNWVNKNDILGQQKRLFETKRGSGCQKRLYRDVGIGKTKFWKSWKIFENFETA